MIQMNDETDEYFDIYNDIIILSILAKITLSLISDFVATQNQGRAAFQGA